jgi:uncharacterized membrane protein
VSASKVKRSRIDSVDLLRGVIMLVMALDHVRDYFGAASVNPTDLATTTIPLFFTRWVTHICAPVFFLLTGTGAFLALRRRSRRGLSRFLLTRGLWLIFLELVVVRCLGWQWNFDYHLTMLTVLWALGWSMIVLSGLVYLPPVVVAAIGAVMIAGHNLFDGVKAASFGSFAPVWTVLHSPGVLYSDGSHLVFAAYVLIPWVGVTAVGYGLGQIYEWPVERRQRFLVRAGLALVAAFGLLRALNVYGDPSRWATQKSAVFTILSFINTTKYPPSLLFLLMTLGPALLLLRVFDARKSSSANPALIVGRVPMFYYIAHVVVIHTLAFVASLVRYGDVHSVFESPTLDRFPITQPPGWPLSLPWVYAIWITVLVILYPACRWYARKKLGSANPWLSYL